MKQERRVMIFCPDASERQQIRWFLETYFKGKFPQHASSIAMQEFDGIYRPVGNLTVGALDEREILYVIDKHSSVNRHIMTEKEIQSAKAEYDKWRRESYRESFKVINEKDIPYIFYEGEFALFRSGRRVTYYDQKVLEKQFVNKMETNRNGKSIHDRILERLVKPLSSK